MFISFEWGDWIARSPYVNAVWLSGIAVLMISRVPTVSLKPIRIPHYLVLPTLLGVGVLAGLFTTAPWPTLTLIGAVYVGSIPLTMRAYYRLRRAAEARKAEALAEPAAVPDAPSSVIPLSGHHPANEWRH
jgi:CDP-diacylglycerol--serine O-phosphatidyltransferase